MPDCVDLAAFHVAMVANACAAALLIAYAVWLALFGDDDDPPAFA